MTSSKFVGVSSKGRILSHSSTNKSSNMAGGAVPLLLKNLIKSPIKGGTLNEVGKSNIQVGTITSAAQPQKRSSSGGELLNSMKNLKFGKGLKTRKDENIKFVF